MLPLEHLPGYLEKYTFSLVRCINLSITTLKLQSNGRTLAVDGWAGTFGTARRGLGGAAASPGRSSLYQM